MDRSQIEDLAAQLRNAPNVVFITGAGASKRAGIPLAGELVKQAHKDFPRNLRRLAEADRDDYGKVMGKLSPGERNALIEPHLNKAKVSWGQIALASIMAIPLSRSW